MKPSNQAATSCPSKSLLARSKGLRTWSSKPQGRDEHLFSCDHGCLIAQCLHPVSIAPYPYACDVQWFSAIRPVLGSHQDHIRKIEHLRRDKRRGSYS